MRVGMDGVLEFHGRLARADKRPANPGRYRLQFQLHNQEKIGGKRDRVFWEETLEARNVAAAAEYIVAKEAASAWRAPMQRMHVLGAMQLEKESGEVQSEGSPWAGHVLAQDPQTAEVLGKGTNIAAVARREAKNLAKQSQE